MRTGLPAARRVALAVGSLWVLAWVAWGVLTLVSWTGRTTTVISTSTTAVPSSTFSIRTGTGDIDLTTSIDSLVHVDAHVRYGLHKPTVELRTTPEGVQASGKCWWFEQVCRVNYVIAVPAGLGTVLDTGSGDLTVHALTGDVRATTGSGDVTVREVSGRLILRTGSGDIDSSGLESRSVDTRTGAGDVTLRFTASPTTLQVQAGAGDVMVVVPSGDAYDVQTDAGAGDVSVRVLRDSASAHRISVHTGAGDITVRTDS